MTEKQIRDYVNSGSSMGKAGALDIEEIGSEYIEKIEGCYDNIVGLPSKKTMDLLQEMEKENAKNHRSY